MKNPHRSSLLLCLALFACPAAYAQSALTDAGKQVEYKVEVQQSSSNGDTPLWLTANRYGLSSVEKNNGYLRAAVRHNVDADSLRKWRIGYGADVALSYNYASTFNVQQLYADFQYKLVRLTVGAKERPANLKNAELSSGSQTLGINARPVPMVRIELPEYWNISGRGNWAAIRAHFAYGMMTDGSWQRAYANADGMASCNYIDKALLHTKAGFLRLGNAKKFPLVFEGGLEWATLFGGKSRQSEADGVKLGHGIKDFAKAVFGMGADYTDGIYANSQGNTLGSWLARLTWHGKDWSLGVYYDHFFEDHSQMFLEYGWYDGLVGVEAHLPKNRFVDAVVYEYMKTTYQSGPVYHDHTDAVPDQISAADNYYNHLQYVGWEHWGQAMGNPLFVSPLYNHTSDLSFTCNRFKVHHVGISGTPAPTVHYRVLYTHERGLGTYGVPFDEARTSHSMLFEGCYAPQQIGSGAVGRGWQFRGALAFDKGDLIGNNFGFQLTVSKVGLLSKR